LVYARDRRNIRGWTAEAGGILLAWGGWSTTEGGVLLGLGVVVAEGPGTTNTVYVGLGWGASVTKAPGGRGSNCLWGASFGLAVSRGSRGDVEVMRLFCLASPTVLCGKLYACSCPCPCDGGAA
ncbi:hypothetical protein PGIGA_G00210550, partial [Pangasianodon gigas]|nr:hypothetical protein [Pangasianodon gigas]